MADSDSSLTERAFENISSPKEAAVSFLKAQKEKKRKEARERRERRFPEFVEQSFWIGLAAAMFLAIGYVAQTFGSLAAIATFGATAFISYFLNRNDDELSVTFALTAVAIGGLLIEFVAPGWIVEPIAETLLWWVPDGLFAAFSPVDFAILAGASIAGWWLVDIRLVSRSGVKGSTVAKRFTARLERLIDEWLTITRVSFLFGVTLGVLLLTQAGGLVADSAAEIGGLIAQAPFVASNIGAIALGYLALGGDVPILNMVPLLGEIGATGWLLIAGAMLAIAVGVEYAD